MNAVLGTWSWRAWEDALQVGGFHHSPFLVYFYFSISIHLYYCSLFLSRNNSSASPPPVAPIDHVYGTLGLVKATTTQQYAEMSQLREEIEGRGSYTMFAPSNEAWDRVESVSRLEGNTNKCNNFSHFLLMLWLPQDVRAALESNVNIELYNALHFHMVNRRILTKDMKNDMSVTSMYNDLGIYINHYSNGVSLCTVLKCTRLHEYVIELCL